MTKKAQTISVAKCGNCDSVHVFLWRNGKPFAEAIMDADVAKKFAADVVAVAEEAGLVGAGKAGHVH